MNNQQKEYTLHMEEENKVINLNEFRKAIQPGGSSTDENWLKAIEVGVVFVCKRKNAPRDQLVNELYCILEHKEQHSNLMQKIPTGQTADIWVNTLEFSRAYNFGEEVARVAFGYEDGTRIGPQENKSEVTTDGSDNRSI